MGRMQLPLSPHAPSQPLCSRLDVPPPASDVPEGTWTSDVHSGSDSSPGLAGAVALVRDMSEDPPYCPSGTRAVCCSGRLPYRCLSGLSKLTRPGSSSQEEKAGLRRDMPFPRPQMPGWDVVWQNKTARGQWSAQDRTEHVIVLELWAVHLVLKHFLPYLRGKHVLIWSDNSSTVFYINHQRGTKSARLLRASQAPPRLTSLRAMYLPGERNLVVDFLSRHKPPPREWRLHPQVVHEIWKTLLIAFSARPQASPGGPLLASQDMVLTAKHGLYCGAPWRIPSRIRLLVSAGGGGRIWHPDPCHLQLWYGHWRARPNADCTA